MASSVITGTNTSKLESGFGNVGKGRVSHWFNQWANNGAGRWDGLLPKSDPSNNDDHYIVKDIGGANLYTNIELADRNTDVPNSVWHNAAKKLHCVAAHDNTFEAWTVDYDDVTDNYTISVGAAGNGVDIVGLSRAGSSFRDVSCGLVKTPNNRIWYFAGTDSSNRLRVSYSDDDCATWTTSTLVTLSERIDASATYFTHNNVTKVCVFAGENGSSNSATPSESLFLTLDQNDLSPETATWTSETLPAFKANRQADDHGDICRDSNDNIYIAFKNEGTLNGNDEIQVIKRVPDGTWTGYFTVHAQAETRTRPSIAIKKIDGSNDEELIVVTGKTSAPRPTILVSTAPLSTMVFTTATALFEDLVNGDNFNDPQLWQSDFVANSSSGVLAIAHNETNNTLWQSSFSIAALSLMPVLKDLSTLWSAQENITSDIDLRHSVLNAVTQDVTLQNAIVQAVTSDMQQAWSMLSNVSNNLALNYAVLKSITSDVTTQWSVTESVAQDVSLIWGLRKSIIATLETRQDILNTISTSVNVAYDISNVVIAEIKSQHEILNNVSLDADLRWDSVQLTESGITLNWSTDKALIPINILLIKAERRFFRIQ